LLASPSPSPGEKMSRKPAVKEAKKTSATKRKAKEPTKALRSSVKGRRSYLDEAADEMEATESEQEEPAKTLKGKVTSRSKKEADPDCDVDVE